MIDRTLLIFAKPPRMGLSKTRLAADLGAVEAQRLNRFCHARTIRAALGGPWRTVLCIAPDTSARETAGGLWPASIPRNSQGSGNLGSRLNRAFKDASPGHVAVIGADAADISSGHIWSLFAGLRRHDAAIGPAHDGGFWGLAVSQTARRHGFAFEPVRWSSVHAMSDLVDANRSLKFNRLETLIDLDDQASVIRWQKNRASRLLF